MKAVVALAATLALSACTAFASTYSASGAAATVPLAATASVGGLHIRPLAVLEDSRCPASVQCVWAGRVRIRAAISPQHLPVASGPDAPSTAVGRELDLTLGVPVVEFGRTVLLAAVEPAIAVPGTPGPGAYRFTFTVVRAR
ncbi:hypothetical protein [Sphingomonas sp.]|uniref:hypothetical protein n=1 Tax=Sphingomonas sp. TaxID=28214 RepID=UPI00286E4F37|nr:hypothetical protein [Sphingomonas sp.]